MAGFNVKLSKPTSFSRRFLCMIPLMTGLVAGRIVWQEQMHLRSPLSAAVTWKTVEGFECYFNDLIFAEGRFVGVGSRGICYESEDGLIWTKDTIPGLSQSDLGFIYYKTPDENDENGFFITITTDGILLVSDDDETVVVSRSDAFPGYRTSGPAIHRNDDPEGAISAEALRPLCAGDLFLLSGQRVGFKRIGTRPDRFDTRFRPAIAGVYVLRGKSGGERSRGKSILP
ncbi:MAG: hypothetical protein JXA18_11815 [Chitinispirillaceae bacterium]|nr:hypothetical protein [Chitinispirillaceae bacterium]